MQGHRDRSPFGVAEDLGVVHLVVVQVVTEAELSELGRHGGRARRQPDQGGELEVRGGGGLERWAGRGLGLQKAGSLHGKGKRWSAGGGCSRPIHCYAEPAVWTGQNAYDRTRTVPDSHAVRLGRV